MLCRCSHRSALFTASQAADGFLTALPTFSHGQQQEEACTPPCSPTSIRTALVDDHSTLPSNDILLGASSYDAPSSATELLLEQSLQCACNHCRYEMNDQLSHFRVRYTRPRSEAYPIRNDAVRSRCSLYVVNYFEANTKKADHHPWCVEDAISHQTSFPGLCETVL